ncbi:MFS transporter [Paenarthrobacter nitroguajacolicus]|uniref:MFS transporter n=1 Tax=Paenarthrobacter nitroguajacolicus TaxID=211146 RepID=UPI000ABDF000|nr:MFS transporter [Paenarthrobacter nitroguajacolicus]
MSQIPSGRTTRPWWTAVVSGMASYIDAAAIVSFGTAMVLYQAVLGLTPGEIGLASGGLTLGIAFGAIIGGRLGDRFGRRPVFTVTMVLIIGAALALAFAGSFPVIMIAALLLGLGTGADLPVSLSTISEAASDQNRGKLIGFSHLLWAAGIIVCSFLSAGVASLGQLGAQILFFHIAVVAVLVLIGRLTIPESTTWLVARDERRRRIKTVRADRASVKDLLRGSYRTPFLALLGFYALTNLAANTGGQFGSYLLVNAGGVDLQTATLIGLPFIPLGIVGALWFMKIADSSKRFTYFKIGAICWVASQLVYVVFGISLTTAIIAGLIGLVGSSFASEGIMKVWTQEQFPTLLRTTAQGTIIAVARLFAALLATVTPLLVALSPNLFYLFLAIVIAAGCGIAWKVFMTRDRHDEFNTEAQKDMVPAA